MLALHLLGCIYVTETVHIYDTADSGARRPFEDEPRGTPLVGDATLYDRQEYGFAASVLSIEHATIMNGPLVNNDWDLMFGNDQEERLDRFTVGMATDDESFIVDLGNLESLAQIPETVDPAEHQVGLYGEADDIEVRKDHVYLVRTKDPNTSQYAMVLVREHQVDDHAVVHWCRSTEPDRFVAPPGCCE